MIFGIDVGGIYIDFVFMQNGKILCKFKVMMDKGDLFKLVMNVIQVVIMFEDIKYLCCIVLSMMMMINVVVQYQFDLVGLIVMSGLGVVYGDLLFYDKVCFVKGYMNYCGMEVEGVDEDEILELKKVFV